MSCTKRQLVQAALDELGIAGFEFDVDPQQLEQALSRLDSMMAEWSAEGVNLGYLLPSIAGNSNLSDIAGIPDWAQKAVGVHLAIDIAPTYGKAINPETRIKAKKSWDVLLARSTFPPEMRLGALPSGAGNKSIDAPFLVPEGEDLVTGSGSDLEFN